MKREKVVAVVKGVGWFALGCVVMAAILVLLDVSSGLPLWRVFCAGGAMAIMVGCMERARAC